MTCWRNVGLSCMTIHSSFHFFSQEICNQHRYRKQRKQQLLRLQETAFNLQRKASYLSEKMEYYQRYVKTCLDSLTRASVRWVIQHTKKLSWNYNYSEFLSLYNNITFRDPNALKKHHDSTNQSCNTTKGFLLGWHLDDFDMKWHFTVRIALFFQSSMQSHNHIFELGLCFGHHFLLSIINVWTLDLQIWWCS